MHSCTLYICVCQCDLGLYIMIMHNYNFTQCLCLNREDCYFSLKEQGSWLTKALLLWLIMWKMTVTIFCLYNVFLYILYIYIYIPIKICNVIILCLWTHWLNGKVLNEMVKGGVRFLFSAYCSGQSQLNTILY